MQVSDIYIMNGVEHTVISIDNTTVLTCWVNGSYCPNNPHVAWDAEYPWHRRFNKRWWSKDKFGEGKSFELKSPDVPKLPTGDDNERDWI